MTPAEKLKALRKQLNMTRQQFSEWSLLPPDTLYSWEEGRREIKPWQELFIDLLADKASREKKRKKG